MRIEEYAGSDTLTLEQNHIKKVLIRVRLLNRELVIENGFLDKVEDNTAVRIWSEKRQQEKGDSFEYGDLPYLLDVKVDKYLFRARAQYWNPPYSCLNFGKVDLVPTIEEYTTLLRCLKVQVNKAYSRASNVLTFLNKLINITGMSEQWVATRIKKEIINASLRKVCGI
ncbi:hypothetical protein Gohar_021763 [Gossypium harknessii]|uniref:DUF7745 domain-containing protein n=1 Tax=Gossypium harknessii TaxID=34285 RepID=A0A7J9IBV4_9ROSI|nr:hypothetical protein [Gossypium harknessii]